MKNIPMTYYTEGTVDAINFDSGNIRFSLLPSSDYLRRLDGNVKMVLFIQDTNKTLATGIMETLDGKLLKPVKNDAGNDVIWFRVSRSFLPCPIDTLLGVKANRFVIRVRLESFTKTIVLESNSAFKAFDACSLQIK